MMVGRRASFFILALSFLLAAPAAVARDFARSHEGPKNETPASLKDIGIDPHLGAKLNLDLPFVDHEGRPVTLRELMQDGKPILLSLAYYSVSKPL